MSNRGKNPNSLKALSEHRNRKGQRNKAAVAFSRTLRELIVKEGERTLTLDGKKHKKVELLIRKVWGEALSGKEWATIFLAERVEGKIKDQIEVNAQIAVKGYATVSPDDWDIDSGKPTEP